MWYHTYDTFRGHACILAVFIPVVLIKVWSACPAYSKYNNYWEKLGLTVMVFKWRGRWPAVRMEKIAYNLIPHTQLCRCVKPFNERILTSSNLSKEAPSCMNSGRCFCQLNSYDLVMAAHKPEGKDEDDTRGKMMGYFLLMKVVFRVSIWWHKCITNYQV